MLPQGCIDLCLSINVSDVECPSVYAFLFFWLMNKPALTYGRAEYSQAGRDIKRN